MPNLPPLSASVAPASVAPAFECEIVFWALLRAAFFFLGEHQTLAAGVDSSAPLAASPILLYEPGAATVLGTRRVPCSLLLQS